MENSYLTDLDVSWNFLGPEAILKLSAALVQNRKLQYLNISWNNIRNTDPSKKMNDEKVMSEADEDLIENLVKFVKHNHKLIHLDLGNTGLTKNMLKQFGPALRRARSLVSLHLSGNPGVDSDLKTGLFTRVHCMPMFETNRIAVASFGNVEKVQ